jgi:predicted transcriptional regulator
MRTTLTLDDDVARRLETEASRSGRPFDLLANEYLRVALAQRKALQLDGFAAEQSTRGVQQKG